MKAILSITILVFSCLQAISQQSYLTKKGFVLDGYDVTEYFEGQAIKGNKMYNSTYDGVKFAFLTEKNKEKFEKNPQCFIPQYGGYCAYALGLKDELVGVDEKTFEIRNGKLYLFYNSWGVNTLNKWKDENPNKLQKIADDNWEDRLD